MRTPLPRRRIILAIAVLALGLLGGVGGSLALSWTRADEAEAVADEAEAERDEAVAAIEDLCTQVEQLGRTCVEDPADFEGAEGPAGPPGPGPSDAQVYAAVANYLADNPVTAAGPTSAEIAVAVANYLRDYPPGPTPEQVSTAVASYLTANPPAAGEPGTDGADGATGPPGPEGPQGETGPPPSAEDVAAAVQAWMEANKFPDCYEDGWEWAPYTVVTTEGGVDTVLCVAVEE
jgi:hypothetical protein